MTLKSEIKFTPAPEVYDHPKVSGYILADELAVGTTIEISTEWKITPLSAGLKFKRRINITDPGDEQESIKEVI